MGARWFVLSCPPTHLGEADLELAREVGAAPLEARVRLLGDDKDEVDRRRAAAVEVDCAGQHDLVA